MTNEEIMKVVRPAISAQLKSPASAQFPEELIKITGNDASGYHVDGFVDSQNSYGAMLRNDFTADVQISENGTPKVIKSTVAAKTSVQQAKNFGMTWIVLMIICGAIGLITYLAMKSSLGF
jgi:hypothetical protein